MSKVKLNKPVLNLKDKPFQDDADNQLTFGDVFLTLLSQPKDNDDNKLDKYKLAIKCVADEVDLDLDERKLIKDLANESSFSPIIYGRIHDLLEGNDGES